MTNEEAIYGLKMYCQNCKYEDVENCGYDGEIDCAIAVAVKAIGKQISVKPDICIGLESVGYSRYVCPICGAVIADFIGRNFVKMPTCYCGQKIDWTGEK